MNRDDITRIIKSQKNSGALIDGVNEIVKQEIKQLESRFLGMILETLGASKLRNMLTRKGVMRAGKGVVRTGAGYNAVNRMGQDF